MELCSTSSYPVSCSKRPLRSCGNKCEACPHTKLFFENGKDDGCGCGLWKWKKYHFQQKTRIRITLEIDSDVLCDETQDTIETD